ncbi:MAG TPA: acetate--CoA ligase family protein [bacterium]|nr:acetate--CoA ligase family protein [bacterium]HPT29752.1 acetate--CoA ligase family protein [bacterium]
MNFNAFFHPRSVAIIGASRNPQKIGQQILANLIAGGYKGKIYPVNPEARSILGQKVYSSISIIKNKVDLAVLALPAPLVLAELEKCGQSGVKNVIIIAAGFGETSAAGKEAEAAMAKIARQYNLNILGPNCLGLISHQSHLNASFAKYAGLNDVKRQHNIALVSQSGAIASSILDFADANQIGLSHFVSLGNEAHLEEADIFSYLLSDPKTEMVAVYLEQIKDGEKFLAKLSRLAKVKPVIILKAGQTKAGEAAAKSHTGSLVGSYGATKVAVERCGAILANNLSELFNFLILAGRTRKIDTNNLTIISNAGGPLVLSADEALSHGFILPEFSKKTGKGLSKKLPPLVRIHNPLDLLGDADAKRYELALQTVAADALVKNILVILTPQTVTEITATAQAIVAAAKKNPAKIFSAVFLGGEEVAPGIEILRRSLIPAFPYPETAISSLIKLVGYYRRIKTVKPYEINSGKKIIATGKLMDFLESLKLLEKYHLPVAATKKISPQQINLRYPLAVKIVGPNLIHKSEYRAVFPNLESPLELKRLFHHPLLSGAGNYLVAQERIEGGVEMLLGFKRDEVFGPIIMLGYGGIYTEAFKDVVSALADLDLAQAKQMIASLKCYPLLSGKRTGDRLAIDELAKAIVKIAKLAKDHPEISELDINPLFVLSDKIKVVDVRIIN